MNQKLKGLRSVLFYHLKYLVHILRSLITDLEAKHGPGDSIEDWATNFGV